MLWRLTFAATKKAAQLSKMPRAYPWRLTFAATKKAARLSKMPRPCPVETHVRGYKESCTIL